MLREGVGIDEDEERGDEANILYRYHDVDW